MKKDIIEFLKELIYLTISITIVEFLFYKLKLLKDFSIAYIIGFIIGWSIIEIIKLIIKNQKK